MGGRKKLIEVALPLDEINAAGAREKSIRHGHPSTLHLWWSRKPLAVARAVLFGQLVDDPSAVPEEFPTPAAQDAERARLFGLLGELVRWENTGDEPLLQRARAEIRRSWRRACADNADHPRAAELFDPERPPAFHDPFAGGGALPLEAQRLGLEAHASDLNPVAVLINKAMIEVPPRFAGRPPVNPADRADMAGGGGWPGASGLAADVRHYGGWMRDEAARRIGHLYPEAEVTAAMAAERPDLAPYVGRRLTVIAWLWARTVRSPNPAFADVEVPLASSFVLSSRKGREAHVEPVVEGRTYRFVVKAGTPPDPQAAKLGTSAGKRRAFRCILSGVPVPYRHIRAEGHAQRLGSRLMALVAAGDRGRVYLSPTGEHAAAASRAEPTWRPDCEMPRKHRDFKGPAYGLSNLGDLFTDRQLVALTTFSDLVAEARAVVAAHAAEAGMDTDGRPLADGGSGARAYAEAVGLYLAFALDKCSDYWNTIATWMPRGTVGHAFSKQAIPMTWDFPEAAPLETFHCAWTEAVAWVAKSLEWLPQRGWGRGQARQFDAASNNPLPNSIVSTDPPYYDNIGYADLSDFFYVWLRRALKATFPDLFATVAVPKTEELVATPHRHGSKEAAEKFFLFGMGQVLERLAKATHPAFPVTIYYAYKQSERKGDAGTTSTGWETFLDAVIRSGFGITGTWPMRTERSGRSTGIGANVLASSIVLVCRRRTEDAPLATRRQFIGALRDRLAPAIAHMQSGNIAPVDLAQAAIGPGMAAYTRYAQVLDASGKPMTVREALALINQILDEVLSEREGDFDTDSRWALVWFEEVGFDAGDFGRAEGLSKGKNTSVAGMETAGFISSRAGKVRLLRPEELPADWDPRADSRPATWKMVHHLIRVLDTEGEAGAAMIVRALGDAADSARELCYRLYAICDRKKRAAEALRYNTLVRSWSEIDRLARLPASSQRDLFDPAGRGGEAQ